MKQEIITYPLDPPFDDYEYRSLRNRYVGKLAESYMKDDALGILESSEDIPVSLRDIYVPLRIGEEEEVPEDKRLFIEDALLRHPCLAISGPPGAGKSTFTRFFAVDAAAGGINPRIRKMGRRLVLPFILRELDFSRIHNFEELWSQWLTNLRTRLDIPELKREFFDFYIRQGWVIIIFDGFDEIGDQQNKALLGWLSQWISQLTPAIPQGGCRPSIIITGRPTGFLADGDYSAFDKMYLQPFTDEDIELFIKKFFTVRYAHDPARKELKTTDLIEKIRTYGGLRELKHRPIYLSMLAYISEVDGELPQTRTLAYSRIVDAYVHQLEMKKNLDARRGLKSFPDWSRQDRSILLEELAYCFHNVADEKLKGKTNHESQQLQIQLPWEEVIALIRQIISREEARFETMGLEDDPHIILAYYLARTGLLMEPKDGFVQFSHLTFQEYLTAARIYRRQRRRNNEGYLKMELFDKLARSTMWKEVALQFFGIDSMKQGEQQSELLRFVIDEKAANHHDFLLELFFITDNRLMEEEIFLWLTTMMFSWVSDNNPYTFSSAIRELPYLCEKHNKKEWTEKLVTFLKDLYDEVCKNKELSYDRGGYLPSLEDEEEIAARLASRPHESWPIVLGNILYIGSFWDDFPTQKLDLLTPLQEVHSQWPMKTMAIFEKYLVLSPDPSKVLIQAIAARLSPNFIEINFGTYNFISLSLISRHDPYGHLVCRLLITGWASLASFIEEPDINMVRDMGMARDIDMARDRSSVVVMKVARDMAMDRAMAMDMAMDMDMDMARAMARARHIFILPRKLPITKADQLFAPMKDGLKTFLQKTFFFVYSQTARVDSKTLKIPIKSDEKNLRFLAKQLATKKKAIEYFEKECGELSEKRREETWEWLQQPYSPRQIINKVLQNGTCFDQELIVKNFKKEIEELTVKAEELKRAEQE